MNIFWFFMPFVFNYHVRTFISRQNHPNINMIYYSTDPSVIWLTQRFRHLEIPTKCQCLNDITILMPTDRVFDTIVDVEYGYHAIT